MGRTLTVRIARTLLLTAVLLLLVVSITTRVNSYFVARKFQAVLAGLKNVQIDQTTEEELAGAVPYLRLNENNAISDPGGERWYFAGFTNESAWRRFEQFASDHPDQWFSHKWMFQFADWLGFRYMRLGASVVVLDGKVSSVYYAVASEDVAPRVLGNLVAVRSVHGYWMERRMPLSVTSAEDQSPMYKVKETAHRPSGDESIETSLEISYGFDAPPEMTAHAFQADLRCFWGVRGCRNGREILLLAWQDKHAIEAAALARLQSNDPCPDNVLEGRMRYLPDVDVFLVEVTNTFEENVHAAKGVVSNQATYYRVLELLHGEMGIPQVLFYNRINIPSPVDPAQRIPNPNGAPNNPGDRLLIFGNHNFDSCGIVRATPSAESTVRATEPIQKRREDQIVTGRML